MTRGKRQQVSLSEGSKKPMLQSIEDLQEEMRAQLESSSMNLNSELEELRAKKKGNWNPIWLSKKKPWQR
jgi:hypothetical protein